MSLPPATILIKRKATDEPIDYFRVHESAGKRQRRGEDYVFTRQPTQEALNVDTPLSTPPGVRRIKAIHRSTSSQSNLAKVTQSASQDTSASNQGQPGTRSSHDPPAVNVRLPSPVPGPQSVQIVPPTRKFHISRNPTSSVTPQNLTGDAAGRKRGNKNETIFVERRTRRKVAEDSGKASAKEGSAQAIFTQASDIRPLKKPGLAARSSVSRVPSQTQNETVNPARVRVPSAFSDDFVAQMQAYTLQEIGHSIAQADSFSSASSSPSVTPRKTQKSKFTPKPPNLRYHERHPESVPPKQSSDIDMHPYASEEDEDDDSEYIIETYVRVPADSMDTDEAPKAYGLLVLDSQPDIDEFYRNDEDSDEEEVDEEEDENAENHYSADYPDEEVDSDDEYNRNAYNYRTHNASDLEEFDEDDATFSDEDNDATKYPWMKKSWTAKQGVHIDADDD
ncbi:hypothetical protein BP5796_09963 [Coleophoma crateriformis]|uniref:Transcription factor Iwr1 domain-containing protein n=1 Tax=Coleophoma crateriformis TaxID=565419 RepID=A0A3D8QUA9_9HELO|nr:hypothetical protein BP5796_09963 [Coleophoma crateriformis]